MHANANVGLYTFYISEIFYIKVLTKYKLYIIINYKKIIVVKLLYYIITFNIIKKNDFFI